MFIYIRSLGGVPKTWTFIEYLGLGVAKTSTFIEYLGTGSLKPRLLSSIWG